MKPSIRFRRVVQYIDTQLQERLHSSTRNTTEICQMRSISCDVCGSFLQCLHPSHVAPQDNRCELLPLLQLEIPSKSCLIGSDLSQGEHGTLVSILSRSIANAKHDTLSLPRELSPAATKIDRCATIPKDTSQRSISRLRLRLCRMALGACRGF